MGICIYFLPKFVQAPADKSWRTRANQFKQLFQGGDLERDRREMAESVFTAASGFTTGCSIRDSTFGGNFTGSLPASGNVCGACGHALLPNNTRHDDAMPLPEKRNLSSKAQR